MKFWKIFSLGLIGVIGCSFFCLKEVQASERRLLARVLSEEIYEDQIVPSQEEIDRERENRSEKDIQGTLFRWKLETFKSLIFTPLIDKYCQEHRIEVSIEDAVAFVRSQIERSDGLIKVTEEEKKHLYHACRSKMLWMKFSKAIYDEYGGSIYGTHMGDIYPDEAFKKFLEEQNVKGMFEIIDPEFENLFWTKLDNYGARKGYMTKEEAEKMFDILFSIYHLRSDSAGDKN